jgi:hypothetical protein
MDASHKRADSAFKYTLYFEFMARNIKEYDVQPEDMLNMEEEEFLIGVYLKAK